jgi:photosynthetic reaction center H subunit
MSEVGAITSYIDVAQLVLYAFWIFFAGLIYYLHRENKREGYPLQSDRSGRVVVQGWPPVPAPKTYRLVGGHTVSIPKPPTPESAISAEPMGRFPGAPLVPVGDPLLAGVGPGAWAAREDVVELTHEGATKIVPLRLAEGYDIAHEDVDPRGMTVEGDDGVTAGTVRDLWVDRSDVMFRYLEVAPAAGGTALLLPLNFVSFERGRVHVGALLGAQIAGVPRQRHPDQVTRLEEEKIAAYLGAGTLYAEPRRAEPLL